MSAAVSFSFTLFLTPVFLRFFRKWGWAQVIRTPEDGIIPSHGAKRGTPTMGGTIFIVGTLVGYGVGLVFGGGFPSLSVLLAIWLMIGIGAIGLIDDLMKIRGQNSRGLSGWKKILGQVIVMIPFGVVALNFPNEFGETPAPGVISLFREIPALNFFLLAPVVAWALYLIWITLIGVAASNGVNVADGLDGLATGCAVFVVGTLSLISFWKFKQACYQENIDEAVIAACYNVREPLSLATFAATFAAALIGFLWWQAPKAQVFMGDVGSFAIGGVIAALAILTRTELLLIFIGGVFVLAPGSVILQKLVFKLTGRRRRLFLLSPFHHHLEMKGWSEPTIIVRLWIITGMLAATGVGLFYVEWLIRA